MKLNVREIPFSTHGSYFAVSYFDRYEKDMRDLYIRNIGGGWSGNDPYAIVPTQNGVPSAYTLDCSPTLLKMDTPDGGIIEMCFPTRDELRIRGTGTDFRIFLGKREYASGNAISDDTAMICNTGSKLAVKVLKGAFVVESPWEAAGYGCEKVVVDITADNGEFELALSTFPNSYVPLDTSLSFDACLQKSVAVYTDFLRAMLPETYTEAQEKAAYLIWSATIKPQGLLKRDAVLMSKNWMTSVWSWDHCFNALALTKSHPQLAWDQFLLPFDFCDKYGSLQDAVNDKLVISAFVKPPIHGLTLRKMMAACDWIDDAKLREIYPLLCRWTDWWFDYMDYDRDGVPQYMHGNDSGWDNSTVFRNGTPVESPDLSAFLVEQMDVLADVAERLDKPGEAAQWRTRSDKMLRDLLAHFAVGDELCAVKSHTHERIESDSLLVVIPLLIGKKLPDAMRAKLIAKAKSFLTEYGFATEKPDSPYYTPDGYWRGPIWAPPTFILHEALQRVGENELAKDVAKKFVALCTKGGMAENFDALTGEGLRDLSYTWTASVFLLLAQEA